MKRTRAAVTLGVLAVVACNGELRFDDHDIPIDSATIDGGVSERDAASEPWGCLTDADCRSTSLYCRSDHRCVECRGDGDCKASDRPRCSDGAICVACLEDRDCGQGRACETITHRCVDSCAEGAEFCPDQTFLCDERAKQCIECLENGHCAGHKSGPLCDPTLHMCVRCWSNVQCSGDKAICDRRTGECVECRRSIECTGEIGACDPKTLRCIP